MASKRKITVTKASKKTTVSVDKGGRKIRVNRDKAAGTTTAKTLFYCPTTPHGKIRRAYFLAFIVAQLGKLVANKPFLVWPSANFKTHVDDKRIKKVGRNTYALTADGVEFFSKDEELPPKELMDEMVAAVTKGKASSNLGFALRPLPTK